jgi:hypothetical protein
MSGTATLSLGGLLHFHTCVAVDIHGNIIEDVSTCYTKADEGLANIEKQNCPNWNPVAYGCRRKRQLDLSRNVWISDQPATGEWNITFGYWFLPKKGYKHTFFATVLYGTADKPGEIWDSVTLTCSP